MFKTGFQIQDVMRELGKCDSTSVQSIPLKTLGRFKTAQRRLLLSSKDYVSNLGESAVVHHDQIALFSFGDEAEMSENDPAVARTVERLSENGHDTPMTQQKKEARISGGILSR